MNNIDLSPEEFEKSFKAHPDAVLIDVRTPEEFETGHLPGAININVMGSDFPQQVEALVKTHAYYVYCRSGARSANACQYMKQHGFDEIFNLQGGILAWTGEVEY